MVQSMVSHHYDRRSLFSSPVREVQRAILVTFPSVSAWAWALASHFKVLRQSFFMLCARHCQANHPVQGQVFFDFLFVS